MSEFDIKSLNIQYIIAYYLQFTGIFFPSTFFFSFFSILDYHSAVYCDFVFFYQPFLFLFPIAVLQCTFIFFIIHLLFLFLFPFPAAPTWSSRHTVQNVESRVNAANPQPKSNFSFRLASDDFQINHDNSNTQICTYR